MQYRYDQSQHGSEEARSNEERQIGQGGGEDSPDWMNTLRSQRDEVRRFKEDNKTLVIA